MWVGAKSKVAVYAAFISNIRHGADVGLAVFDSVSAFGGVQQGLCWEKPADGLG